MTLTEDQEEKFRHAIHTLDDHRELLSAWEISFLDDQLKRYDEWGSNVRLSPKQWAIIDRMMGKVEK